VQVCGRSGPRGNLDVVWGPFGASADIGVHEFSAKDGASVEGAKKFVTVMVKGAKKYASTGILRKRRRTKRDFEVSLLMANLTSFQSDIRPLFTERDIHAMSKAFNLGSYDDVKAHAAIIYDRIRGIGGAVMPPPPPRGEGPWPQSRIELFGKWISDGYQA
jgi:hypothetical protein